MKHILKNILMASIVLALVAGCGGGAKEKSAAEQPASAQPTQAPAAAPAQTAEEEASLTLENRQSGLEQLKSYRVRWGGAWKTTESGKTTEATWEWLQEYTADPEAMHWRMNSSNSTETEKASALEMWRIGAMTYMVNAEAGADAECISYSSDDQDPIDQNMFDPGSMGRIEDAKYVGTETINGVRAKHYKYDEKATTFVAASKVSGELWVAVDGGYVVKDTMAWEGGSGGLLGATTEGQGQGTWTWEITDINAIPTITPPAGCESAAGDLPILPDASEKAQFGDMITYKTATSLADAAKFYQEEMVKAGWTVAGEAQISQEFGTLTFGKDGQTAQVMLSPDNDKTTVMITIEK